MSPKKNCRRINSRKALVLCAIYAVLFSLGTATRAQTSAFTYQGKLSDAGAPPIG